MMDNTSEIVEAISYVVFVILLVFTFTFILI